MTRPCPAASCLPPNFVLANAIGIGWAAALLTWFFSARHLPAALGYSPVRVGLAFLPASLLMALVSLHLWVRLVSRFGRGIPLAGGLVLAVTGLGLLARAPVPGGYAGDVLPEMLLFGVAGGIVQNPLLPRPVMSQPTTRAWHQGLSTRRS